MPYESGNVVAENTTALLTAPYLTNSERLAYLAHEHLKRMAHVARDNWRRDDEWVRERRKQ